jgi:hypothetical protein
VDEYKSKYGEAWSLYRQRKYTEALALLDGLVSSFPASAEVARARAMCLSAMEQARAAKDRPGEQKRPRPFSRLLRFCFFVVCLVALGTGVVAVCVHQYAGEGRRWTVQLEPGPKAPPVDSGPLSRELGNTATRTGQAALRQWAAMPLGNWEATAKGEAWRVCLAKLATGTDVEEVNRYLLAATPWSNSGSGWWGHKGDYDFTEVGLIEVLYEFGEEPDVLYPETVKHVLDVLLVDEGGTPRPMVPRTLGLVLDTENHHLMAEGSRYLKNQWLFEHGPPGKRANPLYDNAANGMEQWIIAYLEELRDEGVYEFNSVPYYGRTIHGLLNLDAYPASREISSLARHVLDTINWQYALGSHGLRRCAPFRRRYENAGSTALSGHSHNAYMQVWTGDPFGAGTDPVQLKGRTSLMVLAELLPYRLPDAVRQWTLSKPHEYFVRFGRGPKATPEIYSGGPGYLLSAGGVHRGPRSLIIARPTTLMLRDGVTDMNQCFRLPGQGEFTDWNNTGVHHRFACSNAPVAIPEGHGEAGRQGNWQVFAPNPSEHCRIVTYSRPGLGLLIVFPDTAEPPEALLDTVAKANSDEEVLTSVFSWPDGRTIGYDVNAPKGTWGIASVDGEPVDRDYDAWPQISGDPPAITFTRQ